MNSINKLWVDELLVPIHACYRGIRIANQFDDAQTAWKQWPAEYVDDMFWTIVHSPMGGDRKKTVSVMLAIVFAKNCLKNFEDVLDDDRPRKAIEATEAWIQSKDEAARSAAAAASAWSESARSAESAWSAQKELILSLIPRNPLLENSENES